MPPFLQSPHYKQCSDIRRSDSSPSHRSLIPAYNGHRVVDLSVISTVLVSRQLIGFLSVFVGYKINIRSILQDWGKP